MLMVALFVFEMFDSDRNGLLDYDEFDDMMSAVFGAKRPMGGVLKQ
jgi:Ca2+-binding EF-hand superfamily protein